MLQLSARPVITAASTHLLLRTGKVPGKEASKKDTKELGGAANWTCEPEKSFELELICA